MHRVGGTVSFGYRAKGYDVTLGATGAWGWGNASIYNFAAEDPDRLWQPAEYQERSIYVFIAGVQKAVQKTAKKVWTRVIDKRGRADQDEEASEDAASGSGEDATLNSDGVAAVQDDGDEADAAAASDADSDEAAAPPVSGPEAAEEEE